MAAESWPKQRNNVLVGLVNFQLGKQRLQVLNRAYRGSRRGILLLFLLVAAWGTRTGGQVAVGVVVGPWMCAAKARFLAAKTSICVPSRLTILRSGMRSLRSLCSLSRMLRHHTISKKAKTVLNPTLAFAFNVAEQPRVTEKSQSQAGSGPQRKPHPRLQLRPLLLRLPLRRLRFHLPRSIPRVRLSGHWFARVSRPWCKCGCKQTFERE